ncbi:MAG: hypothetical protein MZW92_23095 [Comamonadaceae bacterium]|nr:hypothetical protein [Comamonadaceae bacterium]
MPRLVGAIERAGGRQHDPVDLDRSRSPHPRAPTLTRIERRRPHADARADRQPRAHRAERDQHRHELCWTPKANAAGSINVAERRRRSRCCCAASRRCATSAGRCSASKRAIDSGKCPARASTPAAR